MNKKQQIVEILKCLLKKQHGKWTYWKDDIETAIMECRGSDKRTVINWWNYLWRLGYFKQIQHGIYTLNVDRLTQLECPELVAHQSTLIEHTHTQSLVGGEGES